MYIGTFLRLELKNLFASRAVSLAFLFVALASAYAIYHGGNTIDRQRAVIKELPLLQKEHTDKLLGYKQGAELGDALYYLTFTTFHEPSSWAGFALGQRDVNSYNIRVRVLALEGQIYDSELTNPTSLLYGNFDLSFVIVFVIPLLIIALTHNLLSAEQESGTWNLLRSQPVSPLVILSLRLLLRFVLVTLTALALLLVGVWLLSAEFDGRLVSAALLTILYIACWFGIAAFAISFNRTSTFNALALLGVWIVFTLLAPALVATVTATAYPVSESLETAVRQREGYHEKWDRTKLDTMQRFYQRYPQLNIYPIPEDKFSWGWYYAMQHMGDEDSAAATKGYREKLEERNRFTQRASWVLPTVAAQLGFNEIAGTDLAGHLEYLDSVRVYHQELRENFYPHIFRNAMLSEVDVKNVPPGSFINDSDPDLISSSAIAIFITSVFFILAAGINLARSGSRL